MIEVREDRALWQRYVSGEDPEALVELFDRKQDLLHRMAVQITGNSADADDALQAALENLLQQRPQQAVQTVQPWLIGVVLNQARSIVRREMRIRNRHQRSAEENLESDQGPLADLEATELQSLLAEALSELPPRYREPLVLHYIEGMKFKDIALSLERKEETVKKQSQRAIQMMRSKMRERGVSLTALVLVNILQQLHADEQWVYSETASPDALVGAGHVQPWASLTAVAVICMFVALVMFELSGQTESQSGPSPVDEDLLATNKTPAANMEVVEKPQWKQAAYQDVGTCPFGKLKEYAPKERDQPHELGAHEKSVFDQAYWRFSPKGKNPTMFETAQLDLPEEYHMKFEFKIDPLKQKRSAPGQVYLGFTFNRTGKKIPIKGVQKPLKQIAEQIHSEVDKWHTVDIEVRHVDNTGLRDVLYSINGELYWHIQTAIPSRDIIPIGVNNTAVLMRNFVYLDFASIN